MNLLGCATCQVNMAQGGGDAAGWSIFFLLVVILLVLGVVIVTLARLIKRGNDFNDPDLNDGPMPPAPQS